MDSNSSNPYATDQANMDDEQENSLNSNLEGFEGIEDPSDENGPREEEDGRFDEYSSGSDVTFMFDQRRKKRRKNEIQGALETTHVLSPVAQEGLLQELLKGGWGKFAHCMTRHFKAPGRYGHKLVDIALITAIYDRTIACVTPVMFSPISMPDFEEETGMDKANLSKALGHLVEKAVLLRIKVSPRVIFWALNPHFFRLKEKGELTRVKTTQGSLPQGNAPRSKDGNAPCANTGQSNLGGSYQTTGNQKEKSVAKNLLKESKKESLLSGGNFPDGILARWSRFQKLDLEARIRKEREIFERMFIQHGDSFFHFSGLVVEFLEKEGTVKAGKKIEVRCPFTWIDGHWEENLTRYRNWKTEKEDLDQAHALKLNREAKAKAEQEQKGRQEQEESRKAEEWKVQQDAAALRFLSQYSTVDEIQAFSAEAIDLLACKFTHDAWIKSGWNHPIVRSRVLNHFMMVERGERATSVQPSKQEESA